MMAMETSSPLAAMQPPQSRAWYQNPDDAVFQSRFLIPQRPLEYRSFDFKDMSMQRSNADYFSFKSVRGSSPTQSLAVDLSQNFHIDQTPQLPTPRRSLFTKPVSRDETPRQVTTPPIPSSSPAVDHMEVSPLPHKQPQLQMDEIVLCSPTPDPTPVTDQPPEFPEFRQTEVQSEQPSFPKLVEERRTFEPVRPSLKKNFSSSNVLPLRCRTTGPLQQPFRFGSGTGFTKPSLETFIESPPSEKKIAPSVSNPALISQPLSANPLISTGSPIPNARRPSLGSRQRSGTARRSHSMQCGESYRPPREQKRCCTTGSIPPSLSMEESHQLKLPHFKPVDEVDGLPRITRDTLVDVLDGNVAGDIGDTSIIDCRFEYEYEGGHIDGALNFNDKDEMARELFEKSSDVNRTLIFHCEYSAHRAPLMAKYIRQRDRTVNQDNYPRLTYPDIYILDGGYSGFFSQHPVRCYPQNYVGMGDKEHESACEKGMARVKRRAKLSRAQTYAFGQSESSSRSEIPPVPPIPSGFPTLNTSFDSMDIDFNTSVQVNPFISPLESDCSPLSARPVSSHSKRQMRRLESF